MLQDKVILVTGASRGLGQATAKCLSQLGCCLALCARAKEIDDAPWLTARPAEKRLYASVDLRHPQEINEFVRQVQQKFGRLDVLINCAAVLGTHTTIAESSLEEWQEAVSTNIIGSVAMLKACLPLLRQSKGAVIQVVSSAGVMPISHFSTYCTTKAAQIMLTRTLAAEESGIIAVNYDPSMMDTDMQATIRTEIVPHMPPAFKQYFTQAYDNDLMIDTGTAGCALAYTACTLSPAQHSTVINGGDPQLHCRALQWVKAKI